MRIKLLLFIVSSDRAELCHFELLYVIIIYSDTFYVEVNAQTRELHLRLRCRWGKHFMRRRISVAQMHLKRSDGTAYLA